MVKLLSLLLLWPFLKMNKLWSLCMKINATPTKKATL